MGVILTYNQNIYEVPTQLFEPKSKVVSSNNYFNLTPFAYFEDSTIKKSELDVPSNHSDDVGEHSVSQNVFVQRNDASYTMFIDRNFTNNLLQGLFDIKERLGTDLQSYINNSKVDESRHRFTFYVDQMNFRVASTREHLLGTQLYDRNTKGFRMLNMYPDGRICWGSSQPNFPQGFGFVDKELFNANFNLDLTPTQRYQPFNTDEVKRVKLELTNLLKLKGYSTKEMKPFLDYILEVFSKEFQTSPYAMGYKDEQIPTMVAVVLSGFLGINVDYFYNSPKGDE